MSHNRTEKEKADAAAGKIRRAVIEEEVLRTNGFSKPRYTDAEIIEAMPGTGGIIATLAARLGVEWHTAKRYVTVLPAVREVYEAECEVVSDRAESVLIASINAGSVGDAKWWLSRKRRDQFSTKKEIVYSGDVDIRRLSDGELEALIASESDGRTGIEAQA